MRNAWIWVVLAAIIVVGGVLWYQSSMSTQPTVQGPTADEIADAQNQNNTDTQPDTSDSTAGELKEFTVSNSGFAFNPKSITVKKGDRVKITYTSSGGTHDFTLDGYDVGTEVLNPGESETIEFVADTAGSFEYYCSVSNHRAMGMKGTLTVTE